MTNAQINTVNECNDAMRYFANRLKDAIDGLLPGKLAWREIKTISDYCNAEFHQIRMLRDFIRFER